jgi:Flp pilus assembly protein TadD
VLALVPDHVGANNNVAWVLMKEGKPGYLAFAERAGQIAPADASILDTLAAARAGEKQWVRALEAQRKAIELAPAAPGYRLNLAKLLIASGDAAAAKIELRNLAAMGDKFAAQSEVARLLRGL